MKRLVAPVLAVIGASVIGAPASTVPTAQAAPARATAALVKEIKVGGPSWGVAAGAGAVWVQVDDVGAVRVDSATGTVTTKGPEVAYLAFGDGRLWASAFTRVLELDPATGAVLRTIPHPSLAGYLAFDYGSLWLPTHSGLLRIDAASGQVVAEIAMPPCPEERKNLTTGFDSVWVACKAGPDPGRVDRVDATTNSFQASIRTDVGANTLAVVGGAVWVTNYQANTVSRIDPATNSVTATVPGVGAGVGIAFGDGAVWAGGPGGISKIDPATATVVERLEVPVSRFYYGIAFGDGSLWVSATYRDSLLRIDPRAAAPARERIRARVTAAVDGDTIKVLTSRRRTLRVRLLGIDAPATSRRSTSGECGGRQARANLRGLSFKRRRGRMVTLTTDPTQDRTDPKRRLLAYAKLDSGKLLQAEQLRAGWATVHVSADPFERLAQFRRLQRSARSAKHGVWGKCSGDFHLPLR